MKISLCIEPLLKNYSIEEKIRTVADIGFRAIELWDIGKYNMEMLKKISRDEEIKYVMCSLYDSGQVSLESESYIFSEHLKKTIYYASEINCKCINLLCNTHEPIKRKDNWIRQVVDNLIKAVDLIQNEDINITIEALNSTIDHPNYCMDHTVYVKEILSIVGTKRILMNYDIYHMQVMEGNIVNTIQDNINLIGHLHSANLPGRHELNYGEINYHYILSELNRISYDKYFGIEYWPIFDTKIFIIRNSI